MIYLVGVNHWMQYQTDKKCKDFLKYIRKVIKEKGIEVIAEEWNAEADKLNSIQQSNLSALAQQLNLRLLQVEPLEEQQPELGIITKAEILARTKEKVPHIKKLKDIHEREKISLELRKQNYAPRENHWFAVIKPHLNKSVIFVCGNDHLSNFSTKLEKENVVFEVLSKDKWVLTEFHPNFVL